MQAVAKRFHTTGWQPPPDWDQRDTGVFGDAIHEDLTNRYINDPNKLTDVWLDAEGKVIAYDKGYGWKPANTKGTTQIDLLIVKSRYKPVEGLPLDRTRLIAPVDFKSSGRAKWKLLSADIGERVIQHTGLELWAPVCEHRYNFALRAMEASKNVARGIKLLKGVNRALPLAMLLSLPHVGQAMDHAVFTARNFVVESNNPRATESGSQMQMALAVDEVLRLLSLDPLQELPNHYITLAAGVLEAKDLFDLDPEYDSP